MNGAGADSLLAGGTCWHSLAEEGFYFSEYEGGTRWYALVRYIHFVANKEFRFSRINTVFSCYLISRSSVACVAALPPIKNRETNLKPHNIPRKIGSICLSRISLGIPPGISCRAKL